MPDIYTLEVVAPSDTFSATLSYGQSVVEHSVVAVDDSISADIFAGFIGPKGDKGDPGLSVTFTFSASSNWTINHNLGRRPAIEVYTSGGMLVFAEILHLNTNTAQIAFETPMAGFAIIT